MSSRSFTCRQVPARLGPRTCLPGETLSLTIYLNIDRYSGSATEDRSGANAVIARRAQQDHELASLLNAVGEFLPRPDRQGGCKQSDFAVDSSTIMHLRRRFSLIATGLLSSSVSGPLDLWCPFVLIVAALSSPVDHGHGLSKRDLP